MAHLNQRDSVNKTALPLMSTSIELLAGKLWRSSIQGAIAVILLAVFSSASLFGQDKDSDPEGYKLTVNDAVRVTWGGVYVHSAPWSVGSQGYSNVSHGCINLSPDNASWYFNQVHIGDPVVINA